MPAQARTDINVEKLREYLRLPDGPVARRLMVVAENVKVRTIASLKPGFPQDWLGARVLKRAVDMEDGIHVMVGADDIHTRPHLIRGNDYLVFDWPKGGLHPAIFPLVHHPGSDFARYLTKKLTEALESAGEGAAE